MKRSLHFITYKSGEAEGRRIARNHSVVKGSRVMGFSSEWE